MVIVMLNKQILDDTLVYDKETGVFTFKERHSKYFKSERSCAQWNSRFAGKVAGCTIDNGSGKHYRLLSVLDIKIRAHHAAFLMVTGARHRKNIDHINGNGLDNSWLNLRDNIDQSENLKNMKLTSRNKSGFTGVFYDEERLKWMAYINVKGKRTYLGRFKCLQDAINERKKANLKYEFHENHGSKRPLY